MPIPLQQLYCTILSAHVGLFQSILGYSSCSYLPVYSKNTTNISSLSLCFYSMSCCEWSSMPTVPWQQHLSLSLSLSLYTQHITFPSPTHTLTYSVSLSHFSSLHQSYSPFIHTFLTRLLMLHPFLSFLLPFLCPAAVVDFPSMEHSALGSSGGGRRPFNASGTHHKVYMWHLSDP